MWTFQPIKIGRASVLLMAGGRTMFSYGKITTPAVDTSGHKVSIDVNSFKWIGGRLNGILGVQVALPLGKFKIAPYVIHYSLSNPANWGMDGGPKDNLGVQSINGAHPVLNEKQKVICLGADIINISHGIALGISMTHVPSTEYAFFGNVEATTASSKSTTTAYNMLSVSLIFYSAALNK